MDGLNRSQRKAVETLRGPLLVLAGAGSGKTRVVTFRIANLIRNGVLPERILAVTFTNKAATEMKQRVAERLGRALPKLPDVSTFHSHCVRILKRHIQRLGYPPQFAISDVGEQTAIARDALRKIKVSEAMVRPGDLVSLISGWKSLSLRPQQAAAAACSDKEHLAAAAYRRYQQTLKLRGMVDFDDLLLLTEELLTDMPDVHREESGRYDHLLVDEYQDTNGPQYRIVSALARSHRNLCVVGDDDQSIYAWRGAEVRHILNFKRDWPDATVVYLEENYRSTAAILDVANRVIAYNKQRHPKVLRAARPGGEKPRIEQYENEQAEAEGTVSDIRGRIGQRGLEPRDFAILFRTNEQPRLFETALRQAKIPYVLIGSSSFYDRKEVRDIIAYLKVIDAPHDDTSLLRIINTPPRGIGDRTVEWVMARASEQRIPIWEVLGRDDLLHGLSAAASAASRKFRATIDRFRAQRADRPLQTTLAELLDEIAYQDELRNLYPDADERDARWNSVGHLMNALVEFEQGRDDPRLRDFLNELMLTTREEPEDKEKRLRSNAVALMTLHAAKGLEFPHTYLVGLEEGILPHHRSVAIDGPAIDEERRLCYVGITRAQERLTISLALTRMKWGKPRETLPSRFIFEIIGQAEKFAEAAARHAEKTKAGAGKTRGAKA
ncbi:MAG: AAA family ATPase [Planctomycetes bacterium]|nr:AAA family ATPase [Planctomycetota bacterium]